MAKADPLLVELALEHPDFVVWWTTKHVATVEGLCQCCHTGGSPGTPFPCRFADAAKAATDPTSPIRRAAAAKLARTRR